MAQVALLVETALGSGREILKGISQYVYEHDNWQVFHYTGSLGVMVPEVLEHWEGDGIIARINDPWLVDGLKQKKVPVVDVLGNIEKTGFACVKSDNRAISTMVFEYFYEKGYRDVGFLGVEGEVWSEERKAAFEACAEAGEVRCYCKMVSHAMKQHWSWNAYLESMCDWLLELPKPTAVFVCSDQFAPDLVSACSVANLKIPEEIALIGVDNDPAFCEVVRPSLSSVNADHVQVGFSAARLLDSLMSGTEVNTNAVIRIPPSGIVSRRSSDAFALEDPGLQKAVKLIRMRACEGIGVEDVARSSGYSRSVLQRRFRDQLGRTVHDVILSTRLDRARELLSLTRLPLLEVALRSGFNHQEYLNHVFKERVGMTPGEYRKRFPER